MMMVLGNIKEYTKELKEEFRHRIEEIGESPKLAIIQVGNVKASNSYIKNKVKNCEEVGIVVNVYQYPEDSTESEICEAIRLDQDYYDGVIVELPLPPHIRQKVAVAAINPLKNIDDSKSVSEGMCEFLDNIIRAKEIGSLKHE